MKIRTGFVSNSSSSSFVAWGVKSSLIQVSDDFWLGVFDKQYESCKNMATSATGLYKGVYIKRLEDFNQCKTDGEKIEYARCYFRYEFATEGFTEGGARWRFHWFYRNILDFKVSRYTVTGYQCAGCL